MTTDQHTPDAPRVRADGPGGFHVATNEGKSTPWWRLVGDNGEILGHSQVYASISNAHRGVEAAERTTIVNSHRAGPVLYDVLREMDAADAHVETIAGEPAAWRGLPAALVQAVADLHTRDQLVTLAGLAILWADSLIDPEDTNLATLAGLLDGHGGEPS